MNHLHPVSRNIFVAAVLLAASLLPALASSYSVFPADGQVSGGVASIPVTVHWGSYAPELDDYYEVTVYVTQGKTTGRTTVGPRYTSTTSNGYTETIVVSPSAGGKFRSGPANVRIAIRGYKESRQTFFYDQYGGTIRLRRAR